MIIKVKTLVFCENFTSTETFTYNVIHSGDVHVVLLTVKYGVVSFRTKK